MEFARIAQPPSTLAHPVMVVEFLRKLTEGDKLWGTIDVSPASRSMWRRVRLTVYPPGTTSAERRALHFTHGWPIGGALIALTFVVIVGSAWPPALAFVAMVALYAAGFWLGARLTRPTRDRIRSLAAVSVYVHGELEEYGDAALLRATACRLEQLDARRRSGDLDPVHYEAEWAEIYGMIPDSRIAVR